MDPWDKVKNTIELLFGPLGPDAGESAENLEAVDRKFGLRMPELLRKYYGATGRFRPLNHARDHFASLQNLTLMDDVLIILAETDGSGTWGIFLEDFGLPDPPVYRAEGNALEDWSLDTDNLSEFLIGLTLWQAVYGGMPYVGVFTADDSLSEEIAKTWPEVTPMNSGWEMRIFARKGQIICALGHGAFHVATLNFNGFAAIEYLLNIKEWDMKEMPGENVPESTQP